MEFVLWMHETGWQWFVPISVALVLYFAIMAEINEWRRQKS